MKELDNQIKKFFHKVSDKELENMKEKITSNEILSITEKFPNKSPGRDGFKINSTKCLERS